MRDTTTFCRVCAPVVPRWRLARDVIVRIAVGVPGVGVGVAELAGPKRLVELVWSAAGKRAHHLKRPGVVVSLETGDPVAFASRIETLEFFVAFLLCRRGEAAWLLLRARRSNRRGSRA